MIRFAFGVVSEPYIPDDRKADVIREARWHLAGYALIAALSVAAGSWAAVQLWLLPMLAMKPVHQLQNTIEHLGLPHVDAITENTRTTRTNALMRWLGWNMQYHTAHHAFPGVPCYALPKLHEEIFVEKGRKPPTMSYLAFQWAVLRAFWNGRTEADYPDDAIWISDDTDLATRSAARRGRPAGLTMALRVYQSLWATELRRPGVAERPVAERFDRVREAGFDGMAIDLGAMDIGAARARRRRNSRAPASRDC